MVLDSSWQEGAYTRYRLYATGANAVPNGDRTGSACDDVGCALVQSGALTHNVQCWWNDTGLVYDTSEAIGPVGSSVVQNAIGKVSRFPNYNVTYRF